MSSPPLPPLPPTEGGPAVVAPPAVATSGSAAAAAAALRGLDLSLAGSAVAAGLDQIHPTVASSVAAASSSAGGDLAASLDQSLDGVATAADAASAADAPEYLAALESGALPSKSIDGGRVLMDCAIDKCTRGCTHRVLERLGIGHLERITRRSRMLATTFVAKSGASRVGGWVGWVRVAGRWVGQARASRPPFRSRACWARLWVRSFVRSFVR